MSTLRTGPQGPGGIVPAGGGGAGFQTDLGVMVSARGYVEHVGGTMVNTVNRMMSALEVLQPQWQTPSASVAFQKAKDQWHAANLQLTKALNDIALGLDDSQKAYNQSDLDSTDGITSAVRGLPFS
jgi:WXG100 family type VII secretion target